MVRGRDQWEWEGNKKYIGGKYNQKIYLKIYSIIYVYVHVCVDVCMSIWGLVESLTPLELVLQVLVSHLTWEPPRIHYINL